MQFDDTCLLSTAMIWAMRVARSFSRTVRPSPWPSLLFVFGSFLFNLFGSDEDSDQDNQLSSFDLRLLSRCPGLITSNIFFVDLALRKQEC